MQDSPAVPVSSSGAGPLPQTRNRNFVGRQRVLEALRRSFRADRQSVQVIHGTGGVGKTQLALEYAYRERAHYGTIAWPPAGEPNTLAVHYRRLAERLGVAEPDALVEETRQAVKDALAQRSDWLLIFDDAPAPDHPVVASILTNIGAVLRRTGQADAARAPLERAATIHRASLGAAHPEIARNFAHLGHLHQQRGELQLATRYFQRALTIDQNALGESHPGLIPRLEDLGRCLKQTNEIDAATACYERIAGIRRMAQSVA